MGVLQCPQLSCISLDRRPAASFGDAAWARSDGRCCTLRTHNELIWLMSRQDQTPIISRCLHPLERAFVQGFPPQSLWGLGKGDLLRVTGNAMSVPVIGAIVVRMIHGLVRSGAMAAQINLGEARLVALHNNQASILRAKEALRQEFPNNLWMSVWPPVHH